MMRLVHAKDKTWYIVFYQHTMYVISLSNISINTNFKQITRVELKWTNLYNTLRETTLCAWRYVNCCRSFTNVTLLFALNCLRCLHWCVYPRILMIWRHDKVVRQRTSSATSRHSFITTEWWCNILYQTLCIRQVTFVNFKGKRT